MEIEEIKNIIISEFATLKNVQEAIIKDEKAKEILINQLSILQQNILNKIK